MKRLRMRPLWALLFAMILTWYLHGFFSAWAADRIPHGGFVRDGVAINDTAAIASAPSLALSIRQKISIPAVVSIPIVDSLLAFAQDGKILVSTYDFNSRQWIRQDMALNFADGNQATNPAAALVDDQRWVAFVESVEGVEQLFLAYEKDTTWNFAGEFHNGIPTLNRNPNLRANNPALSLGRVISIPWVAWTEGRTGGVRNIFVARVISSVQSRGRLFDIQPIGESLNAFQDSLADKPDLVFSGADNDEPWVVWTEAAREGELVGKQRVFAARAISDVRQPSGYQWELIGRTAGCDSPDGCALNYDLANNATSIQVTSGILPGESTATPWVIFVETTSRGVSNIHVMRLDIGNPDDPNDDYFTAVGDSLNQQCLAQGGFRGFAGQDPDIIFVGNVPHAVWSDLVSDTRSLFVCHLGATRTGQERWDLNTLSAGLSQLAGNAATQPVLASAGTTPFVAWTEGISTSAIYASYRYPEGPAWGFNRPYSLRIARLGDIISYPCCRSAKWQQHEEQRVNDAPKHQTAPFAVVTSCAHVEGWQNIEEIHFKLEDATGAIFFGRYVAAEDKLYVENPDQPGIFIGGVHPGDEANLETRLATLYTAATKIIRHGPSSPALDIEWVLSLKAVDAEQTLTQTLNIVYDDGTSTGFFAVGSGELLPNLLFLPAIQD